MLRADFAVDENLKVYLMEVNLGPNLSSIKFPENALHYEQLLHNYLRLVGIGQRVEHNSRTRLAKTLKTMQSDDRNIVVHAHVCIRAECMQSCAPVSCRHCLKCLSYEDRMELHSAYQEFTNIGEMRRLIPAPLNKYNATSLSMLSLRNQFMTHWYFGKCFVDKSWC